MATRAIDVARLAPWIVDRPAAPPGVTTPTPVTFPATPLDARVFLAPGADLTQPWTSWPWVDVTDRVRFASGVSTQQGRQDEASLVQVSSGALTLDNRDGRFSRRNPAGPYYGQLTLNTPIMGTINAGSGVKIRLAQYVTEWPTRWDRSSTDSNVPIKTAGILRRLAQGVDAKSAMRRTILAAKPVAYWPLEDGLLSTQASSAVAGVPPLSTAGPITFGSITGPVGSSNVADMTGSHLTANLTGVSSTRWAVGFAHEQTAYNGVGTVTVYTSSATHSQFQFIPPIFAGLPWRVTVLDNTGAFFAELDDASLTADVLFKTWHHYAVSCEQVGGNVVVKFYVNGVLQATNTSAGTMAAAQRLYVQPSNPAIANDFASVCHLEVSNNATTAGAAALNGYAGETAHARIIRLAAEEQLPMVCVAGTSSRCGPQPVATVVDAMRDAEKTDGGALYEVLWGFGYQSLNERTNAPVLLALDFAQQHIAEEPKPADDDQRLRNKWTVSRPSGSAATSEQTTGVFRTGAGGPGVYDDSTAVNVFADSQLADQAGWRRHLGTVDEDRWPDLALRFHGSPGLIDAWCALPFGGRATAANPPAQVAPDIIDTIVEGWLESWDTTAWDARLNTSPYTPYRVGTLAADTGDTSPTLLILTPDSLSLSVGVSTSDVTWLINSSPLWTVNPESFPRLVWWEGEVIQVTNCVGSSSPQTWTVVRSINGVSKAHAANSTGSVYRPGVLALA